MVPLVVRIDRLQTQESTRHVFTKSPVRIGRNKLNDLPLEDPFVSLWHGMLQFDDASVQYLDLASTNGTELNGSPAQPNTLIPLDPEADLLIGPLRLHISRTAAAQDAQEPRSRTFFDLRVRDDSAVGKAGDTLQSAQPQKTQLRAGGITPLPTVPPSPTGQPPAAPLGRTFSEDTWVAATANALLPRYMKYREAWEKLNKQLNDALLAVPMPNRERVLALLTARLPAVGHEPDFRALVAQEASQVESRTPNPSQGPSVFATGSVPPAPAPVISGGTLDLGSGPPAPPGTLRATALLGLFAETYLPGSRQVGQEPEQFLRQLSAVLEAFAQAFIELRRGQDEFNKQMAISSMGSSPLRLGSGNARDILRLLLDSGPDAAAHLRDLTGGFADVMVHQVALLSGIRAGVRALLERLAPEDFTGETPGAKGFGSTLTGLSPLRPLMAWKRYVARYRELTEEERATEGVLFGPEFAFAYARIVGGPVPGKKAASFAGAPAQPGLRKQS